MADREWHFYIVRCSDGSLYSGIALNAERRVKAHNKGTGARYTAGHRPVILVYSEPHVSQLQAMKREAQVKRWSRTAKERLIAGDRTMNTGG